MHHREAHEPSDEELARAAAAFSVELVSFQPTLERLEASDLLPRYHRVRFKVRCRLVYELRPLFVTVRRHGSQIGSENYYTVPFFAGEISPGSEQQYELLSFDSFNVPFQSLSVEMCQPDDYSKRRVSLKHIERARSFVSQGDKTA